VTCVGGGPGPAGRQITMTSLPPRAERRGDRDAFLVRLPETGRLGVGRHAISCTSHPLQSAVRAEVQENLMGARDSVRLDVRGRSLDLRVTTHEHLEHLQDLPCGSAEVGLELEADYTWLIASPTPDYHARFEDARRKKGCSRAGLFDKGAGYA
jgi:hypothetical protein